MDSELKFCIPCARGRHSAHRPKWHRSLHRIAVEASTQQHQAVFATLPLGEGFSLLVPGRMYVQKLHTHFHHGCRTRNHEVNKYLCVPWSPDSKLVLEGKQLCDGSMGCKWMKVGKLEKMEASCMFCSTERRCIGTNDR